VTVPVVPAGSVIVGLGIDLVEVDRIRRAVARTATFAGRIFTSAEQEWCTAANDPAERYAVRWAAKEAVLKSLGVGLGAAAFTDIEVIRAECGAPSIVVHGPAEALSVERGVARFLVSLSHTATLAQATVLALA